MLPHSSEANYVAGMIAVDRADHDGATQHLGEAARLSLADPRIQHEYGVSLLTAGDPAAARAPLERAVELAPYSKESWLALRDTCTALGDQECVDRATAGAATADR